MGFYAGDTYNFILNIPAGLLGATTITSAPLITVLDITDPGSPIVSGQAMTLIAGTNFLYFYSLAVPNSSPKDYVAIYSYATSNSQDLGTATNATYSGGIGTFTFPLPLPVNAIPGNKLTTTGFTASGYDVTGATILTVVPATGVITVAMSNPGSSPATVFGPGSAIAVATVTNQLIGDSDKLHIGDTNINGQVALNATVAQNSTVAKDATVMKSSQYVAPGSDPIVQGISTAIATVLAQSSTFVSLFGTLSQGTLSGLIQDIYDNVFGSWSIDQTHNPPILTISRINGTPIGTFELINNNTVTQRSMVTHPTDSSV